MNYDLKRNGDKNMKKTIINLIILLIFAGLIFVVLTNKNVSNQIIVSIDDVKDKIKDSKTEENNNDGKVNSLQLKNSTFYYNLLTDEQKDIYSSLLDCIKELDTTVKLKKYQYVDEEKTMSDIKIAMQNLFLDHPEVFYVKTNYTVSTIDLIKGKRIEVLLEYTIQDKEQLNKQIADINSVLEPLVNEVKDKDIFEKELYLHDKIATMCKYYKYEDINKIPEECHNIYGCVVSKSAVCDGLSKALQVALDKAGIESIIVSGSLQSELHAWNLVKLDEDWYHVDITSDKSLDKDFKNDASVVTHSYFNITDDKIQKTNTIDNKESLPKATNTKYNYYIYKDKYISSKDDFNKKLTKILNENTDKNLAEFGIEDSAEKIAGKLVVLLGNSKFSEYLSSDRRRFNYYNILDSFILTKQK